jgi:hypothetical protein
MGLNSGALALPANIRLGEVIGSGKHSSLFQYGRKKFSSTGPGWWQWWWRDSNPQPWDGEASVLPLCYHPRPEAVFLVVCDPSVNEL